jgi:hypothetical protein
LGGKTDSVRNESNVRVWFGISIWKLRGCGQEERSKGGFFPPFCDEENSTHPFLNSFERQKWGQQLQNGKWQTTLRKQ